MRYLFKTKEFGLTLSGFYLLRSGFSYKELKHDEVQEVKITRGTITKHPIRTTLFGLLFILVSVIFSINVLNIDKFFYLEGQSYKVAWGIISIVGFLLALGIASLIMVFKRQPIITVITLNGSKEVFSLKEVITSNKLEEFKKLIKQLFKGRCACEI